MKLLALIAILISSPAYAKVSVGDTRPVPFLEAQSNAWTAADISKIIPTDLDETKDDEVAAKVGDHAFQSWINSPLGQSSTVGRTARKVDNALKTEMVVSGADKIDHKFTFQVLAFQSISRVKYKGWLNAEVNFDARSRKGSFEITEKIWHNKKFVISHSANNEEDLSSVGLRWNW